jgi:hypothetical protein
MGLAHLDKQIFEAGEDAGWLLGGLFEVEWGYNGDLDQ